MTTKLSDAMVRLTLDREGARAEVQDLERRYQAIVEARKKDDELDKEKKKKDEKEKSDKDKEESKKQHGKPSGGKFHLPPLTAPDAIGAVPFLGGAGKVGATLMQRFGPLASGIAQGAVEGLDGLDPSVAKAIAGSVDKVATWLGSAVNNLDARLRAVSATFEQVKAVAKAQLLLSGKLDTSNVTGFLQDEFTIQRTMLRFQKAQEDAVMRELGRGGQKAMIDVMRKAFKTN